MNLKEMTDALLFWVSQWAGVALPLAVAMVVGLAICAAAVTALWTRRIGAAPALFGLIAGAFLTLIAVDTRLLHWLVSTPYLVRIRLVMGLLSLLVMAVTFEAVRRSRLKERYAILWMFTGGVILVCAFFPAILDFLTALLGMQYVTAVGVVMFVFFLLVLFHVSLALSKIQEDETATAQRCALLEASVEKLAAELATLRGAPSLEPPTFSLPPVQQHTDGTGCGRRIWRGYFIGAPLIALAATAAVLCSGLRAPQAMVGDEVTHYYMLVRQAETLPTASFTVPIPMGQGGVEVRHYPHTNLWHYVGAWLYRLRSSFSTVQAYQAFFLLQMLVAAFYLVRRRQEVTTPFVLLYLLILASLPAALIFSMTFYQDVPLTAQVLTAFCLLDRRRWMWATVFMMAALGMKETACMFLPAFFIFMVWRRYETVRQLSSRTARIAATAIPVVVAAILLWLPMRVSDRLLEPYGGYYPFRQAEVLFARMTQIVAPPKAATAAPESSEKSVSLYEANIIANHPGDLRQSVNWVLYGGLLMWFVMGMGLIRSVAGWLAPARAQTDRVEWWPWWVGLSYLLPTAWLLKTAPDARFFLPAIPFVMLPMVQSFSRLPRQRIWMSLWVALAIVQSGFVLSKSVRLRQVSPAMKEGMVYLRNHPPRFNRVFMYPEGNYRLFSVAHDWYLNYHLREFWRGDNEFRLKLLDRQNIGAIVVKKHLIEPVDQEITNLGVYPDYFVKQIEADARFRKTFDNAALAIYEFDASELPPLD